MRKAAIPLDKEINFLKSIGPGLISQSVYTKRESFEYNLKLNISNSDKRLKRLSDSCSEQIINL
jgi:hypothetical protein